MDGWLTLAQASQATGLTVDTIRRRLKRGELVGRKVATAYGPAWQVSLNGHTEGVGEPAGDTVAVTTPSPEQPSQGVVTDAREGVGLLEALRLVEKLQEENRNLAGQVGYYQAQIEQLRDMIKMLEAPKERPPSPSPDEEELEEPPSGWWGRVLARIYG
jgi:hypothetical protein